MIRLQAIFVILLFLHGHRSLADDAYFSGTLSHRGDQLQLRVRLGPGGEEAWLDLPELWYAEEPAEVEKREYGALRVTLPFGIGAVDLRPDGPGWHGARDGFELVLQPDSAPPFEKLQFAAGSADSPRGGTLYMPRGIQPVSAVILVGGSAAADRSSWGYRSKANWYARRGVAALAYDRPGPEAQRPDGRPVDFWSHAEDLIATRERLSRHPRIPASSIGVQAGSQGVWITLIAQERCACFPWLVFTGAPAVSPAEQQMQSLVRGMRDDGLAQEAIADAVAYQRLYFAVAHRQDHWSALAEAIESIGDQAWGQYVDQPRNLGDLAWWQRHMDYDPGKALAALDVPLLVMNGSRDWVAPAENNLPLFEFYARAAGNRQVTVLTLNGADHRLELPPGEDETGQWRFFRIHPQAISELEAFLRTYAFR